MRAIIIKQFGGLDGLVIEKLPDPVPQPGSVLIEVKAFGINHAETHMRKGEWAEAATVSGIECVGLVKACPGGEFEPGTKVAAFMGGMGRTINGSYAEYTCPPVTNVIPIKTDLPWEELAVIPESYATAWTCLHRNLEIKNGQTLVIRGATSALGRAAVNIAADAGAKIIATTRKKERFDTLLQLGAERAEIETPTLSESMAERKRIDAVLDLVGNTTFMDSLRLLRRGGRMCLAGPWSPTRPMAKWWSGFETVVICGSIPSTLIKSSGGALAVSFLFGSVATDAHAAPTAGAAAGLIEK
jgi:NADPH2:quinone reductase